MYLQLGMLSRVSLLEGDALSPDALSPETNTFEDATFGATSSSSSSLPNQNRYNTLTARK